MGQHVASAPSLSVHHFCLLVCQVQPAHRLPRQRLWFLPAALTPRNHSPRSITSQFVCLQAGQLGRIFWAVPHTLCHATCCPCAGCQV